MFNKLYGNGLEVINLYTSIFLNSEIKSIIHYSDDMIQSIFEKLSSDDGQVMVPLDDYQGVGDYGFGKKFGWCQDKYGISWQFVLRDE